MTSETSGEVTEIRFDSGDEVEADQLLVVLNDEEQASRRNQIASWNWQRSCSNVQSADSAEINPQSQFDQSRRPAAR